MIRDRIKEFIRVRAGDLVPNDANWRTHPRKQRLALEGLLQEVGYAEALIAYRKDGNLVLIDGHLRAGLDPEQTVPVLVLDVDDEEASKLLASLDPIAELAGAEKDKLAALLASFVAQTDGVRALVETLRGPQRKAGRGDPDAIPELPEKAVSKRGTLWRLGDHRLLCGDSSVTEDVDRLLAGARIHLVNTDPPYNVRVEPRSNNAIAAGLSSFGGPKHHQKLDVERHPSKRNPTGPMRPKDRPLDNDFMPDEDFVALVDRWFGQMARVLVDGRSFYVWGGYSNMALFPHALVRAGLYFSQAIVWVKGWPVLTRKDFMGNHEWAFYGWKKGAAHFFNPAVENAVDVWEVKKVTPTGMVHLTEKPVELAVRAMEYSSRPGENVLDLFGGSGSTLIGAEQTGRRAFLMELDPLYTDVIVKRWEEFTGKKAEREDGKQGLWRGGSSRKKKPAQA